MSGALKHESQFSKRGRAYVTREVKADLADVRKKMRYQENAY